MGERLFKTFGALVLALSLGLGWLWMEYEAFANAPLKVGEEGITLVVLPGSSLTAVARELEGRGVLDQPKYLVWMARLRRQAHAVKAGEYRIDPGTTPRGLLDQLTEGRVIHYGLTFIEGWTFHQMMELLNGNEYLTHTLTGLSDEAIMAKLERPGEHPEGRFLPETYRFARGMSDLDILKRAYQAMSERLAEEWERRAPGLPFKTPYEALILASIVEKETGVPQERRAIAGVFVRRLQKGMRLQTDPTVIYGMGTDFDGNIRRRDLMADTPYNTYRRKGLPPTPIAMPGADALRAALHPEEGEALYFVAKGDGSHHFSATLREHNRAVIRYQLGGRSRPFSSNPR